MVSDRHFEGWAAGTLQHHLVSDHGVPPSEARYNLSKLQLLHSQQDHVALHRRVWIEYHAREAEWPQHPDGCRDRGTWCEVCHCCEHCFHPCACTACSCHETDDPEPVLRVVED